MYIKRVMHSLNSFIISFDAYLEQGFDAEIGSIKYPEREIAKLA